MNKKWLGFWDGVLVGLCAGATLATISIALLSKTFSSAHRHALTEQTNEQ